MSNNPYGAAGGYTASVQFGGEPPQAAPAPAAPDRASLIKDTTTAAFANDVIRESREQPVLVDFWAPWCGPCRQLTPILEKAVLAAAGRIKLVKMNIDEHPAVAGQLGIQSIPAVIAFRNGQPVDGFMGALPESQVAEFIKRVAGVDPGAAIADALAAAADARAKGDNETASRIYSAILEQSPGHVEASAAFADLLFDAGQEEAATSLLDALPADNQEHPQVTAVRTRIRLAREAAALGDPAELEARLARDPKDHDARFDLAAIRNAQGRRIEAADQLLAIIKADRNWRDGAARQQLLKFFDAWGMTDEATVTSRRKLSSILFS